MVVASAGSPSLSRNLPFGHTWPGVNVSRLLLLIKGKKEKCVPLPTARVRGLCGCRQRLEYGSSLCRQSINVSEPGLGLVCVSRLLLSIKEKEEICVPWSGTATATAWSAAPVVAAALATVAWKSQG